MSPFFDPDTRHALTMSGIRAIQAAPLLARDGRVLGVLSTHHRDGVPGERDLLLLDLLSRQAADWLERAHAVDRLEDSERRLRTILHQTVAGIFVADADGRMTYVNRCWCRMLGYREDELVGKHLLEIAKTECLDRTMEALRRLEGGMPSLTLEKRYRRKDGTTMWGSSSVSALRGPDGQYEGSVAVVIDIGEHKRLEQSLRDQADRLELALQTGRLGTWRLDLTTLETQASDQCKANFGLQPHEALNFHRAFEELIHPDDRDAMRAALTQTISAHGDYDADFRVVWPDGSVHWIVSRGRAVYDAEGRAVAMTGVNFDDTERRGAMDRLRENEAQLQRTVEDAPLALCLHADDGEILNLSRHWTELTGYTKNDAPVLQEWLRRAYGIRDGGIPRGDRARLWRRPRDGADRHRDPHAQQRAAHVEPRRVLARPAEGWAALRRCDGAGHHRTQARRSADAPIGGARCVPRVAERSVAAAVGYGRDPVHGRDRICASTSARTGRSTPRCPGRRRHGARPLRSLPREACRRRRQPRMAAFGEDLGHRLRAGRTVVLDDAHASSTLGQANARL